MNETPQIFQQLHRLRDDRDVGSTSNIDETIQRFKALAAIGDYENALRFLPRDSYDQELQNCRAVCLLRLGCFEEAIALLRTIAVNWSSLTLRDDVPKYIQLNFATALAFGGEPAGALDAIGEANASSDPVAVELKSAINHWVAQMSWLRRVDWKLNHIAPKSRPTPTTALLGRFSWEVCPDDKNPAI